MLTNPVTLTFSQRPLSPELDDGVVIQQLDKIELGVEEHSGYDNILSADKNENLWQPDRDSSESEMDNSDIGFWTDVSRVLADNKCRVLVSLMKEIMGKEHSIYQDLTKVGSSAIENETPWVTLILRVIDK